MPFEADHQLLVGLRERDPNETLAGLAKLRLKEEEVIVLHKWFREYAGPLEF